MAGGSFAIYVLRDSDGAVRYVGQTCDPRAREQSHRKPSVSNWSPCARWTRTNAFSFEIIEWTTDPDAAEIKHIGEYRNAGAELLNVTPGGKTFGLRGKHARKHPAYAWAMAFCRRRGNADLSKLIRAAAKKAKQKDLMAEYDAVLFDAIQDAVPACAARLLARA